ncbi:MAG: hypothetical protein ACX931_11105 [Saccharospirillum sp.]
MFIDGLTDTEKHQLAVHLREQEHTAFLVIKHARAAVQCMQRDKNVHPIDLKYLELLDAAIEQLFNKVRPGPSLFYTDAGAQSDQSIG